MKNAVLILEPKGAMLEVVRAAKRRGLSVLVLRSVPSFLELAPTAYKSAVTLIDRVFTLSSWNNPSEAFKFCDDIDREFNIVGVYFVMDLCAIIAAQLRFRYGISTTPPEIYELVLNKFNLRRKLHECGLSKLENYSSKEIDLWSNWIPKGPVYFKPVYGFSSAYVRKCTSLDELKCAIQQFKTENPADPPYLRNFLGSGDNYHVEDAFPGELLSVESISHKGTFQSLGLLSRILYSKDDVVEMGSCFPYPHPQSEKIIRFVEEAHRALGLSDGPSHTEVIVSKNGDIEIIDLNPRFVGADVIQSVNHAYGIKIEESLLDSAMGLPVQIPCEVQKYSCLQYFLPPAIAAFESAELPKTTDVPFSTLFISPGAKLNSRNRQIDYVGCYLTTGPTFDAALKRSFELRSFVRINGIHKGEF